MKIKSNNLFAAQKIRFANFLPIRLASSKNKQVQFAKQKDYFV